VPHAIAEFKAGVFDLENISPNARSSRTP